MSIAIRTAWLQKHRSPAGADGDFHWYPAEGDRELRSSYVERSRGIDPPAVLWQLAPGRVSWTQVFAATAATDGRRYLGLVLSIAECADASPADLLDALELPPAAPFAIAGGHAADAAEASEANDASIARALLSGGAAIVDDPVSPALPARVAALDRTLPASVVARPRHGIWRASGAGHASDRVAELVVAAWRDPSSRAAQAWRLVCELATERSVDDIVAELATATVPTAALTEAERAVVPGARDFAMVLHAWGRGRLDGSVAAATLAGRLADAVALRVLAQLVGGGDPAGAIAEARWRALLPAARRAELLGAVGRRAASLRTLVGDLHG